MDETLEQMQARHRKEQRDLQSRITNKKKNATKKTRKGVNDECAELERQLKERQEAELRKLSGEEEAEGPITDDDDGQPQPQPQPQPQLEPVNGVAAALQTTALSSPPPQRQDQRQEQQQQQQQQHQQQEQQQPQQPPPKKRNRQKERLARRAAEAEAASAAAHSEASTMTDHRALERAAMEREFARHSLAEKEVAPDGHCLFSAVADQLEAHGIPLVPSSQPSLSIPSRAGRGGEGGEREWERGGPDKALPSQQQQPYKIVRRAAAEWMLAHGDEYAGFLEEPLEDYVSRIRDTAEWGGQLELSALAGAYGVEIRVVQGGGAAGGNRVEVVKPAVGARGQGEGEGEGEGQEERKTLWLAYYRHGYGLGEHYNSLRKAG
ncbi:OTU protein [Madurella fahalii]|uniref:OTU protein n=1 Tax=Madurella fahalii TaxID=1157608 RepID=A0ABQ0G821_9PEZI